MKEKSLKAVVARHVASGLELRGYEIHHGETEISGLTSAVVRDDGEVIGYSTSDGLVWGTYLHGVFDADGFRRWFIDRIRTRKGLMPLRKIVAPYDEGYQKGDFLISYAHLCFADNEKAISRFIEICGGKR